MRCSVRVCGHGLQNIKRTSAAGQALSDADFLQLEVCGLRAAGIAGLSGAASGRMAPSKPSGAPVSATGAGSPVSCAEVAPRNPGDGALRGYRHAGSGPTGYGRRAAAPPGPVHRTGDGAALPRLRSFRRSRHAASSLSRSRSANSSRNLCTPRRLPLPGYRLIRNGL